MATIEYDGPMAAPILTRSFSQWQGYLHAARSISQLPSGSLGLEGMLGRTPPLPDKIPKDLTYLEGYSTWANQDPSCQLEIKQERNQKFVLRTTKQTLCTVSTHFGTWEGKENNGIALLVLGWGYVLSASLAERQDLRIVYPELPSTVREKALTLDYAKTEEQTWWARVTTRGVGWAIEGDRGIKFAPWAVSVEDPALEIDGSLEASPPTAEQAACYLARFCRAYDLGSQCVAALSAVLSLPLHSTTSRPRIELPKTSLARRHSLRGRVPAPPEFVNLSYYMALSLNPYIYGSRLWGVFWEPDVPCNLAGAWLGPIAAILEPIVTENNPELLARVMSSTMTAPLWLGLAICGGQGIVKSIIPFLKDGRLYPHTEPSVDSAAWSCQPQSFMDIHPGGPYKQNNRISRANVWRLRHDFHAKYAEDDYSDTPRYGWHPFGEMRVQDVELEIREHLCCSHRWEYQWWTWLPSKVQHPGFSLEAAHRPLTASGHATINDEMAENQMTMNLTGVSKVVTESVFNWCCNQVERGFSSIVHDRGWSSPDVAPQRHQLPAERIWEWLEDISNFELENEKGKLFGPNPEAP